MSAADDPVICRPRFNSFCIDGGFVKNCLEAQEGCNSVDKQNFIKTEDTAIKLENGSDERVKYKYIDEPYIKSEEIEMKTEEGDQDNETFSHNLGKETNENEIKETSNCIGERKYGHVLVNNCLESQEAYFHNNADTEPYKNTEVMKIKVEDGQEYENFDKSSYIKSEEIEIKSEEGDDDDDSSSDGLVETIENRKMQISEGTEQTKCVYIFKCGTEVQINKSETLQDVYTNRYRRKFEAGLNHKFVSKVKNTSEIHMYNCHTCPYKTKSKDHLRCHQLTHKNPSENQMYKCYTCSFETRFKHNLKNHQVIHNNASEIQIYLCDECSYETKRKYDVIRHQLTHKDPSEVHMYKCDTCHFESKYQKHVKYHQLTHKDPSQFQLYRCDDCNYESKHKVELKSHQLTHKDTSEVHMYKCDTCSFKTKSKYYLRIHKMVHKDSSETQLYKCDRCDYETKLKTDLKNHQL